MNKTHSHHEASHDHGHSHESSNSKLGWFRGICIGLAILAAILLWSFADAASPQQPADPLWRVDGRVLDTTGDFSTEATAAFNTAAIKSGYPIYMIIVDGSLLEGNNLYAVDVAKEIMDGRYGASYQWQSSDKHSGLFPDNVVVLVTAPFVQKPNGEIPDDHEWKRAITELIMTNQFSQLGQVMKDSEHTYSVDVANTADLMIQRGEFNTAKVSDAVQYIADAYKAIGMNPQSSGAQAAQTPASAPQLQPTPTNQNSDGGSSGSWAMFIIVILICVVVGTGLALYYYLSEWYIARMRAVAAKQTAANLAGSWDTYVTEARNKVAALSTMATPSEIRELNQSIDKATAQVSKAQGNYNEVMRRAGDPSRWLATKIYVAIQKEIDDNLLVDLKGGEKILIDVKAACEKLEALSKDVTSQVEQAALIVNQALDQTSALMDGEYPSPRLQNSAQQALGLYQTAQQLASTREWTKAQQAAQQSVTTAEATLKEAALWVSRMQGMSTELSELRTKYDQVLNDQEHTSILPSLEALVAASNFAEVRTHPQAIASILSELADDIRAANSQYSQKRYDEVIVTIGVIQDGLTRIESLAKTLKETLEDLTELKAELPGLLGAASSELDSALQYVKQHDELIDDETERALIHASDLLDAAKNELDETLPDLLKAQKWLQEAEKLIKDEWQEAKGEVDALQTARNKATDRIKSSSRSQSKVQNFNEDHDDDVNASTVRMATAAAALHTKAAAAFESAEGLGDGQESERLEHYRAAAKWATEAQEAAEKALEQSEEDCEPPTPTWTPSYGGGYNGGYSIPTTVYRPSTSTGSISSSHSSSGSSMSSSRATTRSYSAPSRPAASPARSSMTSSRATTR